MTAKEYLHKIGVTNAPEKSLYVMRGEEQFDIAQIMEQYSVAKSEPISFNRKGEAFFDGMHTGFLWKGTYYPLTGPVPKVMDREYAIMTTKGPKPVRRGQYVVRNDSGQVIDIVD